MFAPAGLSAQVLAKIHAEVARSLNSPEVRKVFERDGADIVGNTPQQFALILKAEIQKWTKVAKAANIKLD